MTEDGAAAEVVLVTSGDEKHPPENITDRKMETFWMSTGMFPQEFIIRLSSAVKISLITVHSYNVRDLKIEKTTSNDITEFEPLAEKEFECTEGHLQTNDFSVSKALLDLGDLCYLCRYCDNCIKFLLQFNATTATRLRFIITSGYDHFISVHNVTVDGKYE
ncbi:intraflagellar transport protein 25 homolog isoform X1 [Scleropages formosus]|uniref:intraflagellar transport protein 25 homolog isoform X1 n=1 Tax=Scleropages formosus TaxID=113540 RepID=UPI0008788E79|nr:intraflagellar transport protein 25 homolog isoform X1 [Scleropages formosus]